MCALEQGQGVPVRVYQAVIAVLLVLVGVLGSTAWVLVGDSAAQAARIERLNADVRRFAEKSYQAEERYDQDVHEYAEAAQLSLWRLEQCEAGK